MYSSCKMLIVCPNWIRIYAYLVVFTIPRRIIIIFIYYFAPSVINYKGEPYISVKEISRILSNRKPYENAARQKIVLYFSNNRVKISNLSSFIVVNDKIFQMTKNAFGKKEDIYVPAKSFFSILKNSIYPGVDYDSGKKLLSLNLITFNINSVAI